MKTIISGVIIVVLGAMVCQHFNINPNTVFVTVPAAAPHPLEVVTSPAPRPSEDRTPAPAIAISAPPTVASLPPLTPAPQEASLPPSAPVTVDTPAPSNAQPLVTNPVSQVAVQPVPSTPTGSALGFTAEAGTARTQPLMAVPVPIYGYAPASGYVPPSGYAQAPQNYRQAYPSQRYPVKPPTLIQRMFPGKQQPPPRTAAPPRTGIFAAQHRH